MKTLSDALCHTLPNGLRVVIVPEHGSPVVEIRLALPFARTRSELTAPMDLLAACVLRGTQSLDRHAVIRRAASARSWDAPATRNRCCCPPACSPRDSAGPSNCLPTW